MAIYDCFQFFNEEHVLDLRINILQEFVDFFVVEVVVSKGPKEELASESVG